MRSQQSAGDVGYSDHAMCWTTRNRISSPGCVCLLQNVQMTTGAHATPTKPQFWLQWALSQGVKWPDLEVEHTIQSSAKFKNEWGCISTSAYVFVACIGTALHIRTQTCIVAPPRKHSIFMKISLLQSNWCTLCNNINIKIDLNYIIHSDMFRSTQGPSSGSSLVLR